MLFLFVFIRVHSWIGLFFCFFFVLFVTFVDKNSEFHRQPTG